jgi:hypothetical protein
MRELAGRLLRPPVKRANAKATPGKRQSGLGAYAASRADDQHDVIFCHETLAYLSKTFGSNARYLEQNSHPTPINPLLPVIARRSRGMNRRSMALIRSSEPRQTSCTPCLAGHACVAPKHQARIPFCTCSRFSASSNTTDCGPSITSSVTSSPRWAGKQCMKIASLPAVAISFALTW